MKKINLFILALTTSLFALTSCSDDDSSPIENGNEQDFRNGVFVLNEGAMGSDNAEVTFFRNGEITSNIFKTTNPALNLGNVATHLHFDDNDGYIVVNLSKKIEVVDANTFLTKGTIQQQLNNPRYAETDNNFLYVSNWGDPSNPSDDYISVYKRSDLSFVKKIDVAEGPDQLLIEDQQLYIAHAGGWSNGNSVSIYNLSSQNLTNIVVGDIPSALVEENDRVYVLCSGVTWGGTPSGGKIVEINPTNQQTRVIKEFNIGENPRFLVEHNNQLFYTLNNQIFSLYPEISPALPQAVFTSDAQYIYSFNILNNAIFIGDAKDFASNGEVKYYSLAGQLLGKFTTGIGPNFITLN